MLRIRITNLSFYVVIKAITFIGPTVTDELYRNRLIFKVNDACFWAIPEENHSWNGCESEAEWGEEDWATDGHF